MRLKDILVHFDAKEQATTRLQIAADLAQRHAAHLTGLYAVDIMPAVNPQAGIGGHGEEPGVDIARHWHGTGRR